MDIKKRANQIAHRFQSRNPFEIVRGLNVILVDAPLSGVRGFYQYFQRNHATRPPAKRRRSVP